MSIQEMLLRNALVLNLQYQKVDGFVLVYTDLQIPVNTPFPKIMVCKRRGRQ